MIEQRTNKNEWGMKNNEKKNMIAQANPLWVMGKRIGIRIGEIFEEIVGEIVEKN